MGKIPKATIVAATLAVLEFNGQSAANAAAAPTGFSGGYAHPTTGRVGYHMVSQISFGAEPCRPEEHIAPADMTVAGTLPPGLTPPGLAGNGTPYFEGTPRQAGDWHVVVTMRDLRCDATLGVPGPVSYGDLIVPVDFHIDP